MSEEGARLPEQETRLPGLTPGERSDALSIAALYGRVQAALGRAFSRSGPLWVRGEILSISDRTGHCYVDLVDPDGARGRDAPVLKVNFWARTWTPLKAALEREGIALEPGLVVTLQGRLQVYAPRGQLNFIAADLDVTALLGRLAARRAALLRQLESEGLIRRNAALAVPAVPLRLGLVASRDTEGYRDFVGQLQGSGFGFQVLHVPVHVQGAHAPGQIAGAVTNLSRARCDLVVVVRGGGSRGDLSAFDTEPVARAVASAQVPVWTGIGHTGDQSVADIVANRTFVTPTECGQEVVARVGHWWAGVTQAANVALGRAGKAVTDAMQRDSMSRSRLCASTRNQLKRHSERLEARAAALRESGARSSAEASLRLEQRSTALRRTCLGQIQHQEERAASWRRLMAAYDVERQLERGYTITLDEGGRVLRDVECLVRGSVLETRFARGRARSEVTGVENGGDG